MTVTARLGSAVALLALAGCLAACNPAPGSGDPPSANPEGGAVPTLPTPLDPPVQPAGDTDGPIAVTDARIRAPVPGQDKTVAYLTLENRGATPFVLTGAASSSARAIEIHNIERDGDMVRMRRLSEVVVEPGKRVQFAPGGLHLMVFGIVESPQPFVATLTAADGRRLEVSFATLALGGN